MKKIAILLMFVGLFIAKSSFAGSAGLFSYDAKAVKSELAVLNAVDQFVEQNDVTYTQMLQTENPLASGLSYGTTGAFGIQMMEPALGIPSFLWGCVFNIAGVALVYFVTEDNEETKKAAYGCAAESIFLVGITFLPTALGCAPFFLLPWL